MKGAMTIMTGLQKIAWLSVGALVAGVGLVAAVAGAPADNVELDLR
jgi:hypothetical protein